MVRCPAVSAGGWLSGLVSRWFSSGVFGFAEHARFRQRVRFCQCSMGVPSDHRDSVCLWSGGQYGPAPDRMDSAILPGSFNPIHDGHRRLRQAAAEFLKRPVVYELSRHNVDKPDLSEEQTRQRLQQPFDAPVLVTRAALFTQKAALFPGCWFVVGFDTARRILDPRYCGGDRRKRDDILEYFGAQHVRFLVAGRLDPAQGSGAFRTCRHLTIDRAFRPLFVELPESKFRLDVSSTEIRRRRS